MVLAKNIIPSTSLFLNIFRYSISFSRSKSVFPKSMLYPSFFNSILIPSTILLIVDELILGTITPTKFVFFCS